MSIYHSENLTNQYNSKEEYRDEKRNGWHYTYLITVDHSVPDDLRKYYIGVHTSKNCLPEDSPYLGSCKQLTAFLKQHPEAKVTKIVLACFLTRKDADNHEIELHAEFKVGLNTEYFNRASRISAGFSIFGNTRSKETRQKHSDWFKDPDNADAIAEKGKKISDWHKDPANADAIAERGKKHSDWFKDPGNADTVTERGKKISESSKAYWADPDNADAIAERSKKISDWHKDPANADAIAEKGKKLSESSKGKPKPKFVCRVSDRKEYRVGDITQYGLEKLGLK